MYAKNMSLKDHHWILLGIYANFYALIYVSILITNTGSEKGWKSKSILGAHEWKGPKEAPNTHKMSNKLTITNNFF